MRTLIRSSRGIQNAVEANNFRGVRTGTITKLQLAGYMPDGEPRYVFLAPPVEEDQPVSVHDRRDNFHGGFSFAVWHLGTSLPQMPWAV